MAASKSLVIVVCCTEFWMSTTGDSLTTVTVSWTEPTDMSALTVATNVPPLSTMPSRLTVANPVSVKVTVKVPESRFTTWYCPLSLVTTLRVFSISAGLDASTVTLEVPRPMYLVPLRRY